MRPYGKPASRQRVGPSDRPVLTNPNVLSPAEAEELVQLSLANYAARPDLFEADDTEVDGTTEAEFIEPTSDDTLQEVAEQTTYGAVFLNELIRQQRALSISVAVVFVVLVLTFPLLNFFLRELVAFEIFGFPISWLFLGVLVYPLVWLLAFYFVSTADKYEEEFIKLVK